MSSSLRALRLLVCLLLLAAAGVTVASPPASATWTVYCTGYTRCASAGYSNAGYSQVGSTMFWRMYGGHNCTNYVAYRMVHAGMPNTRPWTGSGNATNWGVARDDLTDQTPAVGAVAWWEAYAHPAGRVGHVAYVERVIDSSTIVVSQDSWGGDFSWARITRGSGSWPTGFIHFPTQEIDNTAVPTITGTPQVGVPLTATAGSWSPRPSATTYRWQAGGDAIPGATSSTYTPTEDQVGEPITVTVTASRTGYATLSATSAATAPVSVARLRTVRTPGLTGVPVVGSVLTATPGSYSPAATSVRYQWMANGRTLPRASDASLLVDESMVGRSLAVRIVASRTGFPNAAVTTPTTGPVAPGRLATGSSPTVAGTPTVGRALAVRPGTFSPADAVATSQWWLVGGTRPLGAGPRYAPTASDLGHRLEVRTTVRRAGYTPLELRTVVDQPVRAVSRMVVAASSSGSPRGSVRVSVQVSALGLTTVPGRVWISRKGQLLAAPRLVGGRASTVVHGLPVGIRVLRLRYRGGGGITSTPLLRKIVTVR